MFGDDRLRAEQKDGEQSEPREIVQKCGNERTWQKAAGGPPIDEQEKASAEAEQVLDEGDRTQAGKGDERPIYETRVNESPAF